MLNSTELEFIMEAHNGLAAKIVQNAGRILNLLFVVLIIIEEI